MSPGAAGPTNDGHYGFVLCHAWISPQGFSCGIIPACLMPFSALRQHGVAPCGSQCLWAFSPCWKHCFGANNVPCGCNPLLQLVQGSRDRNGVVFQFPTVYPLKATWLSGLPVSWFTKLQLKNNFCFQEFNYWGFAHFPYFFWFWKLD